MAQTKDLNILSSKELEVFQQKVRENVKKHLLHDREGGGDAGVMQSKKKRKRKPRNNKFKGWPTKVKHDTESVKLHCDNPLDGLLPGYSSSSKESTSLLGDTETLKSGGLTNKGKTTKRKNKVPRESGRMKIMKGADIKGDLTPESENMESAMGDPVQVESESQPALEVRETIYAVARKKRKRELPAGNPKDHWDHQLRGARFRFINEALYKTSGDEAFRRFNRDKAAFEAYFEGYKQQVTDWPQNPVDVFISYLNSSPQTLVVGDFGCGEAKLAQSVKQKVHSFDMFPTSERVTVCNISKVPLKPETLDVAVYCLSLMGTNWTDYLQEAYRVLKKGGILKVAEVASRFKSVGLFINVLDKLGFTLKNKNLSNKMFYLFDFVKAKKCKYVKTSLTNILKPCEYKRR